MNQAAQVSSAQAAAERYQHGREATLRDLQSRLRLVATEGRIWLDDQRMVLMHGESLGLLREELITSLGHDTARGLLTRIGYASGCRDATIALKRAPHPTIDSLIITGGVLHAIQGYASSHRVTEFTMNPATNAPYFEWIWHDSIEDELHLAKHGLSHEAMCWLEVGYSAGYLSTCVGKRILVREVECRSMGQPHCRNVGKLVGDWGEDAAADLRFFEPQALPQAAPAGAPGTLVARAVAPSSVIGASAAHHVIRHQILRVGPTSATVLLLGESGVGKSLFARELHRQSRRFSAPFVEVNCAAIPDALLESELFGVVKGAYSSATASRPGRFEIADGGTLFLDEVATLSPSAQGKLLRVLQTGELERLGSTQTLRTDVRVIAATNENLESAVRDGRFREDLYYRLNVFPLYIPPLRERREDIPLLVESLLQRFSQQHERQVKGVTPRAMHALLQHRWPGNVRELENVLERGLIMADEGGWVDVHHMFGRQELVSLRHESAGPAASAWRLAEGAAAAVGSAPALVPKSPTDWLQAMATQGLSLPELEALLLRGALAQCQGNVSATARLLGLSRAQVDYRLRTLQSP